MPCLTRDTRRVLALVLPLAAASGCTIDNPLFEVTAAGADSSGEGSASTSATSIAMTTTGPDATSSPTTTQGTSITSATTVDPGTGTTTEPSTTGGMMGVCGDGFTDPGELCDDGNLVDDDGCTAECTLVSCGDGVLDGAEQCDDGNQNDDDACLTTCVPAKCGDNKLQAGVEQCDDGNQNDDDACLNTCVPALCGDGKVYADVEDCDDGNTNAGDGCSPLCMLEAKCGNGQVEDGEKCDDGNNDDINDGCTSKCQPPTCGDGFVQPNQGEQCDDGNMEDNDACRNNCSKNLCGDGVFDTKTEECDGSAEAFKKSVGLCSDTCAINYCFKMTNTANMDFDDPKWFDPCVDKLGTQVHLLVLDSNKVIKYIGSGTKKNKWTYEVLTSSAASVDQWKLVVNHKEVISIGPNGDRLFITAKSSNPNVMVCPSSMGDGYGIIVLPAVGDAPKLVVMPAVGNSGMPRNFKGWTPSGELSYLANGIQPCMDMAPAALVGPTVYFAVTD